jgi:hypothetical protein
MKKIISSSLILAILAVAFTGCLKDKNFDNHTLGLNDPDTGSQKQEYSRS